jgi:hypothetical protein
MRMKGIVAWKCHSCGRQFDTLAGAKCTQCGKITCNVCFGLAKLGSLARLQVPRQGVCRTCVKSGLGKRREGHLRG